MTPQEIEELAVKHESFGFGKVDDFGLSTHGFDPEGLQAFVSELLEKNLLELQTRESPKTRDYRTANESPMASLSGYGLEYEQRISKVKAAKLLHPFPLPKMGHETLLVVGKKYSSTHCLYIQNISGTYVLACSSAKQVDWNSIFGVQV